MITGTNKAILASIFGAFILIVAPEIAYSNIGGAINTPLGNIGFSLGAEAGGIAQALCEIVSWFQGGVGQSIASLAIIFLGIQAFFGKVTWGTALTVAVGVFAIFGSAEIISVITNGAANGCCGGLNASVNFAGISASQCINTQNIF